MQQIEENKLEEELYYEFQDQMVKSQLELEQKRLEKVEKQLLLLNDNLDLQHEYNTILSRINELQKQLDPIDDTESEIVDIVNVSPVVLDPIYSNHAEQIPEDYEDSRSEELSPDDLQSFQSDDVSIAGEDNELKFDDSDLTNYTIRIKDLPPFESFSSFTIPESIKSRLYPYQVDGVYWMADLYKAGKGGILADEMGLGKSISTLALLAGLASCGILKDALIVTPGTLLTQWMQVCHHWFPYFRVIVFHGSMTTNKSNISKILKKANNLHPVIIITTYESIRIHKFFTRSTDCLILDEGHKIRTPGTQITNACKRIKTPFRYILSGTPIQNNLRELWSLMDFCLPGLLGTLDIFNDQFIHPINLGGYANSSSVEVNCAYSCTLSLKKLIDPHFLRRLKKDVAKQLPEKSEFVLLCDLTTAQYNAYCAYLEGNEISKMLDGKINSLVGIDRLRKISNHLELEGPESRSIINKASSVSDIIKSSGKCKILVELLNKWIQGNDKIIIFCQTRQMLDILDRLMQLMNIEYCRMDGNTNIKFRQELVAEFNKNKNIFVFLSTTKTGGLGLNLTGANKVIIFDCDFNPSNDDQSKERIYRFGQTRPVEIYRLISAKTIEEKIYHRQIFKKFLANKILQDPHHKRFFKFEDMRDLFAKPDSASIMETRKEINKITKNAPKNDAPTKNKILDLLQNSSIKSFNHDRVMEAGQQDNDLIQQEADRIAKNALAALRESRKIRRNELSDTLQPMLKKRRFDMTNNNASSLLANLRVKQQLDSGSNAPVRSPALLNKEHKESMIVGIREYLMANKPTTKEIINHFCKDMAQSDKQTFSQMLKGIANLKTTKSGKIWILKEDFE